jgi:hypothetical protein
MNPLLSALFRKMRGIGLPRDVRQMATPLMRGEAKGLARGTYKKGDLTSKQSQALDRILEMGGTSRYDDPRIEDVLDLLQEMYMKGGGR